MKPFVTLLGVLAFSVGYAQKPITFSQPQMPLLTEKENVLTSFVLPVSKGSELKNIDLSFKSKERTLDLSQVSIYVSTRNKRENATLFAKTQQVGRKVKSEGQYKLLAKACMYGLQRIPLLNHIC